MRYKNIQELIECDEQAKEYFENLDDDVQAALMERGEGVNDINELMHFADIIEDRGYIDTTEHKG